MLDNRNSHQLPVFSFQEVVQQRLDLCLRRFRPVALNEAPAAQYDLMTDLQHANMFKVFSDMLRSESLRIQQSKSATFGYLPMMTVATLVVLNTESFCERVLSCLKLVVSDLHVSLKAEEIRMLVMLRMNHGFMEYMRSSYPGHSIVGIQNPSP
jgi:hypothetical protein